MQPDEDSSGVALRYGGALKRTSLTAPVVFALALLAGAGLSFWRDTFAPSLSDVTHGFPVYYVSARLIVEGRWSERVYDDAWFSAQALSMTDGRRGEVYQVNPPTASLLLLPLAGLSMPTARAAWLWLSLTLAVAAVGLTSSAIGRGRDSVFSAGLLALSFAFAPLREDFRLAQVYSCLLFLLALSFWLLSRNGASAAGVPLGAALVTKLSGAPVWLVLLARREWRVIRAGALAAFGIGLVSVAVTGLGGWIGYVSQLLTHIAEQTWPPVLTFQSTAGFFQHMLVGSAEWNIQPIVHAPELALALSLGISLAALAITFMRAYRSDFEVAFAAAVTLGVVLLPLAEDYHYVLLLLPIAVAASRTLRPPVRGRGLAWLALVVALLAAPWPYAALPDDGWSALLGYPRLYGGWLLWAGLVTDSARREDVPR